MEAYADLVAAVAASLSEFGDEHVGDLELRERLCERFPELCEPADSADGAARRLDGLPAGVWRAVATTRQQLLATMVMTGLNRIVASKS